MKAKNDKFKVVGFIGRSRLEDHESFLKKLKKYFEEQNIEVIWDEHIAPFLGANCYERAEIIKNSDLVLSLGGDGTILKIVRDLPKRNSPLVLAVNLGNIGFNTEVKNSEKTFEYLDEFLKGNYYVDNRMLLRVTLYRKGQKIATHLALNEAVINQGNFARLISLRAETDQRKMINFKADGVIVASPTGSTGHSLSAGGPIVHPTIDSIIFTPICPSELSVRPIVIPSNRQLKIVVETERRYVDNTIGLTIDGQIVIPVQYGDEVRIRRSTRKLCFIRKPVGGGSYYKILREKLSWGKKI